MTINELLPILILLFVVFILVSHLQPEFWKALNMSQRWRHLAKLRKL